MEITTFSERLLSRRKKIGLTQPVLAKKINLGKASVMKFEHGLFPRADIVVKIAVALKCRVGWLLDGEGPEDAEVKKAYKPNYLSEEQVKEKALEIIKTLETIPIGHALHVLTSTKEWLLDCHLVDSSNDQFKHQASGHQESLISDVESHGKLPE